MMLSPRSWVMSCGQSIPEAAIAVSRTVYNSLRSHLWSSSDLIP